MTIPNLYHLRLKRGDEQAYPYGGATDFLRSILGRLGSRPRTKGMVVGAILGAVLNPFATPVIAQEAEEEADIPVYERVPITARKAMRISTIHSNGSALACHGTMPSCSVPSDIPSFFGNWRMATRIQLASATLPTVYDVRQRCPSVSHRLKAKEHECEPIPVSLRASVINFML